MRALSIGVFASMCVVNAALAEDTQMPSAERWTVVCDTVAQAFTLSHLWRFEGGISFGDALDVYYELLEATKETGCGMANASEFNTVDLLAAHLVEREGQPESIYVAVLSISGFEVFGISNQPFR